MKTFGEFIRWGNLAPQKHKIPKNPDDRSYHTPPVEKGFYAFPKGFIETFLIGGAGSGSLQNGRFSKFKNKDGKAYKVKGENFEEFKKRFSKNVAKRLRLSFDYDDWYAINADNEYTTYDDFEREYNEGVWEVWIENKPTHFKYDGLIWHHLFSTDPQLDKEYPNYIKIVDSWVLTDIPTYLRCLNAWYGKEKYQSAYQDYSKVKDIYNKGTGFNYGGAPTHYSKDHYEVYIESIQNKVKH